MFEHGIDPISTTKQQSKTSFTGNKQLLDLGGTSKLREKT